MNSHPEAELFAPFYCIQEAFVVFLLGPIIGMAIGAIFELWGRLRQK
jgi:hypothetical protein